MTESSVFLCIQKDGAVKPDTVGAADPRRRDCASPRTARCMFRSPGAFQSYYKNPAATAEAKEPDGWVHTGDAGFFDADGQLTIVDRARDVGRLADGALFAPEIHREQAEILPLHQGGGGVRRRPAISSPPSSTSTSKRSATGPSGGPRLCLLPGAGGARAGLRADRRLHRAGQPRFRRRAEPRRLADPPLPDPAQGARCR